MRIMNDRIGRRAGRTLVATLALALAACDAGSTTGPDGRHAAMQLSAGATTATTLGETVTIKAQVVDGRGNPIPGAEIHWAISAPELLEPLGDGQFRVLGEGPVQVAAVWPRNPSVRAEVTVTIDAGLLASACIVKVDQDAAGTAPRCAQRRVTVRVAPTAEVKP